jgi:hypothetical protein
MGRCTKNIHAQAIASQWFDSGMTQTDTINQIMIVFAPVE